MFRKKDQVSLTLSFVNIIISRPSPTKIFIRWQRHKKCGKTKSIEIDENKTDIDIDEMFPMTCNFISKGSSKWKHKNIEIELFTSSKNMRSKIHKWSFDLAQIERQDVIAENLHCECAALGRVEINIVAFRGNGSSPSECRKLIRSRSMQDSPIPVDENRKIWNSINNTNAKTQIYQSPKERPPLPPALSSELNTPSHGLGSLRRNYAEKKTNFSTRLLFDSTLASDIDQECQKLFNNDLIWDKAHSIPCFGLSIIDIIFQQRGAIDMTTPIAMISQSLSQKSQLNIQASIYCLFSSAFILTQLKSNGFSIEVNNVSLEKKTNELFDNFINKLYTTFSNRLNDTRDESVYCEISDIFKDKMKSEFSAYLSSLCIFALAALLKPSNGKALILSYDIIKWPFMDQSLLNVSDEQSSLMIKEDVLQYCHLMILEVPLFTPDSEDVSSN